MWSLLLLTMRASTLDSMTDWEGVRDCAVQALANNARAMEYVCSYRGIPKAIIKQFNLGFIQDSSDFDALCQVLGIATKPYLYDRSWVAFFCEDIEGKPLTVELRSLDGKEFHRLQHLRARVHPPLFGLTQCFGLLAERGKVALVEGAFDALTFATITRFPVLGIMTKYPSRVQERFLVRWARSILLFLNRDDQGRKTAERIVRVWAKRHPVTVHNSSWWENPTLGLERETDLNDLLQQRGLRATREAIEKGLKG